jgi:hypothetical protein
MNIGPKEQRKRLVMGITAVVFGIGIAAVLISSGIDQWWRLALFIPFWMGALSIFQAREKT